MTMLCRADPGARGANWPRSVCAELVGRTASAEPPRPLLGCSCVWHDERLCSPPSVCTATAGGAREGKEGEEEGSQHSLDMTSALADSACAPLSLNDSLEPRSGRRWASARVQR